MKYLDAVVLLTTLTSLVQGQTRTSSTPLGTSATTQGSISTVVSPSAVPTASACAVVSSSLAKQAGATPMVVAASIANECALSAPINKADALRLIDGIVAGLQFQSDVGHLKNPPAGYPLAGVDLFAEIQQLRNQVNSGSITSEIAFERNFSSILGKAQDGHLSFLFDGLAVFSFQRYFSGFVSVSSDGKSLPSVYLLNDFLAASTGASPNPSPVTKINGKDVALFLAQEGQNVSYGGFQDPDALYNQMFYALNSGAGGSDQVGSFVSPYPTYGYIGDDTTIAFANGSTATALNVAVFNPSYDFDGLRDGASFYNLCCNATAKAAAQGYTLDGGSSGNKGVDKLQKQHLQLKKRQEIVKRREKRQVSHTVSLATSTVHTVSQTVTRIPGYPTPVALSDDLTLSGYFLEETGFEDVAVLVLQAMSEDDPEGFQSAMTTFMDACREQNKKRLIVDLQGNPGGTISLGYDIFKQLFPSIYPYGAGTLRAHEGLDILGKFYTNFTSDLLKTEPNNFTALLQADFYMQYSAEAWANSSGQLFKTWQQLYGPVKTPADNFTNLIRWDVNNTLFNIAMGSIVVSGFGNNTAIESSPFTSQNTIILSDGRCSSTCTILSHLLKYQAKVKSIAMGGRPQKGPMQAVGGVKGSQIYYYPMLASDIYSAYQYADYLGYRSVTAAIESSSSLGPILNDSDYITFRGASQGIGAESISDFSFNWQNNIAENDASYTPLQFVYEAADCRLWFQSSHLTDVRNQWATVAAQAFGLNGTQVFSLCVEGSTNAPSSLSGNATLYNNGVPVNVTTFMPDEGTAGNSGERLSISGAAAIIAIAAALFV